VPAEQAKRKLTTILVSDVVGYSRLAGADEELTLARLRALRSDLIDPIIAVHHGRVVKRTGDGSIVEFGSVVDAVRCAIEAQTGMVERNAGLPPERRIEFRIGIHLGDVMVESDGDLMGDGVNIAARLEGICAPNGICLSEDAYRQVRSRLDLAVTDLGDRELKNIVDPVHVYSLQVGVPARAKPATQSTPAVPVATKKQSMLVPFVAGIVVLLILIAGGAWYFVVAPKSASPVAANVPALAGAAHLSIVVLPFTNLSNDPSQDYFADGITENLTTDLSRIRNSFVIARNTAFTYKGTNVDAKSLGTQLGVRYVLEGSVQRDGNRVRVNAQLIDAESGAHLWADRFEEDFADLFKLQDQIVARIANSLRVELVNAESQRPRPRNLDAVDLTMRGWALLWQSPSRETDKAARDLFEQAVKLDSSDAEAYGGIAYSHARDFINEWTEPGADYATMVIGPADRALAIDPGSGMAAFAKGFILFQFGRANDAKAIAEAALQRNPNLAPLYELLGLAHMLAGDYDKAKSDIEQGMRLSPRDAQLGIWEYAYGEADLGLGRYAAAIDEEHRAIDDDFNAFTPHEALAAAYALSGQDKEAKDELAEAMRLNPKLVSVKSLRPFERQLPRLVEGLREAGLPEDEAPHLSIVVLPFTNLSGDEKQDYFADGITENLTTDLSRIRNSFVIARNTAFTFKGKNVDAKEIGRELGVRYVLEGSVQRDGNRVRVNAQLIDAEKGDHLWAERFEEDLADLFKLQDQIVARLANTLGNELARAEAEKSTHSQNPDAIDLDMRGRALLQQTSKEANGAARAAFEEALKIDPSDADALAGDAYTYALEYAFGWAATKPDYDAKILGQADRAIALKPDTALAYYSKARYFSISGRPNEAIAAANAGLATNPNFAPLYSARHNAENALGRFEEARSDIQQALRLSPRDPQVGYWLMQSGASELSLSHFDAAIDEQQKAINAGFRTYIPYAMLAAAYALEGKMDEAKSNLAHARELNPDLTIQWVTRHSPRLPLWFEGMRKAGLPEQ
jgi:adenylate cyclase